MSERLSALEVKLNNIDKNGIHLANRVQILEEAQEKFNKIK